MAYKLSPNSLIHCDECGEDYSVTYRRCPFCGAKNGPSPSSVTRPSRIPEDDLDPQPEPSRRAVPADPDDTYVFDGQDLFDDSDEDGYVPARHKGGKRLAERSSSNPFANADINWPRMITFICSLVIIVAAMVIVFTVVYPQLRDNDGPTAGNSESPSSPASVSGSDATQPVDPGATDPGTGVTDPGVEPTLDVPPVDPGGLTNISFKGATDNDFTLQPGTSHTITLNFNPADWSGTVTWSSSNPAYATVDANGKVTNVNTTNQLRVAIITVSADGHSLESKVYCVGVTATQPPASNPPTTQPPSGSGTVTVGQQATVDATNGLNVRSGPGTTYSKIVSLPNGSTVNVLEDAGGGWYKISFRDNNGSNVEGYVLGEYLSAN